MLKVAVLGANGFIGKAIVEGIDKLETLAEVTPITRENYTSFSEKQFDIFINAAGNSKRFLAESNPKIDFEKSVKEVFDTVFDFKFKHYVLVSSTEVLSIEMTNYGINKKVVEQLLMLYSYKNDFTLHIINCGAVVGKGMKKGILFDILKGNPIRFKRESSFNFVGTNDICKYIVEMLKSSWHEMKNYSTVLASRRPTSFTDLEELFGVKLDNISEDARVNMPTYFDEGDYVWPGVKSGKECVKEVIDGFKNDPAYLG